MIPRIWKGSVAKYAVQENLLLLNTNVVAFKFMSSWSVGLTVWSLIYISLFVSCFKHQGPITLITDNMPATFPDFPINRRAQVALELYTTERSYVRGLETILEVRHVDTTTHASLLKPFSFKLKTFFNIIHSLRDRPSFSSLKLIISYYFFFTLITCLVTSWYNVLHPVDPNYTKIASSK